MKPHFFLFIVTITYVVVLGQTHTSSKLVFATTKGEVQGKLITAGNGKRVKAFLGIPFAKPPLNDSRFKPPSPMEPWKSPWDATFKRPACIQGLNHQAESYPKFADIFVPDDDSTSEDCLYLDIWVPTTRRKNLAVMVFIHGGAFLIGSSSLNTLDGAILASEENVITVNFNHRLSMFGFLYMDETEAPGNVALMDQAMALRWVRENIASFGGDANTMTVYGQSSGSASVGFQLMLPSSRGLVPRAIFQSGSVFTNRFYSDRPQSLSASSKLAESVNCSLNSNEETAKCLRSKPAEDLVSASISTNNLQYLPTIDGSYFPMEPAKLAEKGFPPINILEGHTTADGFKSALLRAGVFKDELNFFVSETDFENYINKTTPNSTSQIVQSVKASYLNVEDSERPNYRRELVAYVTDIQIICSMSVLANIALRNGNTVYQYEYSYVPEFSPFFAWEEVPHSKELPFVFGLPLNENNNANYTRADKEFSKRMMKYWANFAKYGSPNEPLPITDFFFSPKWPKHDSETKQEYVLNTKSYVKKYVSREVCRYVN